MGIIIISHLLVFILLQASGEKFGYFCSGLSQLYAKTVSGYFGKYQLSVVLLPYLI